ncbi:50S ribosomal protein L15 [candidate division WOR-3 bacterium]|nr:50S ribosomal protein L15 [candidate division WOR-3 bacterium]
MIELNDLPKLTKKRKRVGRGPGCHGTTAGRGTKGQKARGQVHPEFEGGQMPLIRRLPKRGFKNIGRVEYEIVNVKQLNIFPDGTRVTPEKLKQAGLYKGKLPLKILGDGELLRQLTVVAHKFSKKAKEEIEKMGGQIEILE